MPDIVHEAPSSEDDKQAIEVEEWKSRPGNSLYLKAALFEQAFDVSGREMSPVTDMAVEFGDRPARDSDYQAAPRREVGDRVSEQTLRAVDMLENLGANRVCRPGTVRCRIAVYEQITLYERRPRRFFPGDL